MVDITIADELLILATAISPFLAVHAQKWIESFRENKNRKLWLFHTLMATRASRVSDRHVEALNMIDIEYHAKWYHSKKRTVVIHAW